MICTTRSPRTQAVYFPHFGNLVNEIFNTPVSEAVRNGGRNVSSPGVNVSENDDRFILELAVPGHAKKDISITVDNDIMTIKSNKSTDADAVDYRLREFNYAGFERTFVLPDSVDQSKVDAKFSNGVLSITLDKKEEAKPQPARTITIK